MELVLIIILSILEILSLLIGTFIVFTTNNNEKVLNFSVSLGFIVLLLLGAFHLIPEALENYNELFVNIKSFLLIFGFGLLGFGVIVLLDKLGGHHHHDSCGNESHYKHISVVTCLFLVLHNFIEGISLYGVVLSDKKAALLLTFGIALHNIPLGFTLSSTFSKMYSSFKTFLYITLIGSSYLVGALVLYRFSDVLLKPFVLGSLLSFTFGMIIYISVFEFLPLMKDSKNKKMVILGGIIGIVLMSLSLVI